MSQRPSRDRKKPLTMAKIQALLEDSDDGDFSMDDSGEEFTNKSSNEEISSSEDSDNDEDDQNNIDNSNNEPMWMDVTSGKQKSFLFTGNEGIHISPSTDPFEIFSAIVDDEILNLIVNETNISGYKHRGNWEETTSAEIKKFLAIVMYMGLVPYPSIRKYWSSNHKYKNDFVRGIMIRNRFEALLKEIHFSDEEKHPNDRLAKVRDLTNLMNSKFARMRTPGEDIVIDETMVPFRGRLSFRQYLPGKSHKYGIKLFKLCGTDGYTYNLRVYAGKNENIDNTKRHSNSVVLDLLKEYLNEGRTLTVDNFYTNLDLAEELLSKKTHIVGTVRQNMKNSPISKVVLKKGDVTGKQNKHGVVVGAWRDKRYVRFLSTRHTLDKTFSGKKNRKGEEVAKPAAINFYNKRKQGVDLSDQMSSYFCPLRKTIRWFHKVAFSILLGTAVVNALVVYKELVKPAKMKLQISDFREKIIDGLLNDNNTNNTDKVKNQKSHQLVKTEEKDQRNRRIRRRCTGCYKSLKTSVGRQLASNKAPLVNTRCSTCPRAPFMCLDCFNVHNK